LHFVGAESREEFTGTLGALLESLATPDPAPAQPINVTVHTPPVVATINNEPAQVTVNVPEQEQQAPSVVVNVPPALPPDVNVYPPASPAPTVNVTVPTPAPKILDIHRDSAGKITGATERPEE
jgi:hypothetical protein